MRKKTRITDYQLYIEEQVNNYLRTNRTFTLQELADFAGLKVTPSFRRRVNQIAKQSRMIIRRWNYPNGGSVTMYDDGIPF